MRSYSLTKRDVLTAIDCPRLAYLAVRDRTENGGEPAPDASTRLQIAYGRLVGERARFEFPGGTAIVGATFDEAEEGTRHAMRSGAPVLYEPAFSHESTRTRPDIFVRGDGGPWSLWEVKSGGEPKEEYLVDIAVQIHVLESAGVPVRAGLILLDKEATRESPTIFKKLDCDDEARLRLGLVRTTLETLERDLSSAGPPDALLGRRCRDCARRPECWPSLPRHSVLDLYQGQGGWRVIEELILAGAVDATGLPSEAPLTQIQRRQVESIVTDSPIVIGDPRAFVRKQLVFPLHFLDFEAARPPVPDYPGQHPYDLIPFQWSCHVQEAEGAPLVHHEFLWDGPGDPRRAMTDALLRAVRPSGSVLVYSSFEQEVLRNMAAVFPERARELRRLARRLVDLLPVVRAHIYHPAFGGSFSIKNVLPVLAPGHGYDGMTIRDGMEAVWAYHRLSRTDLEDGEREEVSRALLEYCKQDSLAMHQIYRALLGGGGGQ